MDKKQIIASIIECADYFDDNNQPKIATKLTKIAIKLAQFGSDNPFGDYDPPEEEFGEPLDRPQDMGEALDEDYVPPEIDDVEDPFEIDRPDDDSLGLQVLNRDGIE
jgi:hypothetical protein